MSEDISVLLPTTELDAINAMLDSIGEQPITSLVDIEAPDAGTALRRLQQESRAVQLVGWHWNTDVDVVLTPDSESNLVLPANTLKVLFNSMAYGEDLVQRGARLYDRIGHTYDFTDTRTADLVMALPYEEMPEAARQYVMLKAAHIFQQGVLGSTTLDQFAKEAMNGAMLSLQGAEAETGRYNVLYGSWDVFRVINREAF